MDGGVELLLGINGFFAGTGREGYIVGLTRRHEALAQRRVERKERHRKVLLKECQSVKRATKDVGEGPKDRRLLTSNFGRDLFLLIGGERKGTDLRSEE